MAVSGWYMNTMPADAPTTTGATEGEVEDGLLRAWVKGGDRQALGELFARCRQQAYALAVRLCGPAAAEDAVQDAFLNAMRQARSWRGGSARGWLLAAVANTARNHLRAAVRRVRREAAAPPVDPLPEAPDDGELTATLREALGELPEHERDALELRYLAGLDLDVVAGALGRPYKTVHSQIGRGLERLRDILGRRGISAAVTTLPMALVGSLDAAEPPGLAARLERLAASGPGLAGRIPPRLALAASAAVLCALVWLALPAAAGAPAVVGMVAAVPPAAAGDPLRDVFDQPVQVRLLHDRLDEALAVLARGLPADTGFRYAIAHGVEAPWEGITWTPAAPVPLRQALDALCAQAGLAWTARGSVVMVHPRTTAAAEEALHDAIASLREPVLDPAVDDEAFDEAAASAFGGEVSNGIPGIDDATARILRAGITTPEGLGMIIAAGLDPQQPGLGRLVLGLANPSPGWCDETPDLRAETRGEPFPVLRVGPTRMLGERLGEAALRCLQAHAQRPAGLGGVRCQVILAARVAAAVRVAGAADAIANLLAQDPGIESKASGWQIYMGGCLAGLGDARAVPILVTARRGLLQPKLRALAAVGAISELQALRQTAALGWSPAGLDAILGRIASAEPPADVGGHEAQSPPGGSQAFECVTDPGVDEAVALLRAGARSVPPRLALFLAPVERFSASFGHPLSAALARCGGADGAAALLAWADSGGQTARAAGWALGLCEDPRALPVLGEAAAGPWSGRAQAAAVGLASGRLAGAAAALRKAIAATADAGHSAELWSAALGSRDDALAGEALAEVLRRGPAGAAILAGLRMARTPTALLGGWALAGDPQAAIELRLAALRGLPKRDLPARGQTLIAMLGERAGPPEIRVAVLLSGLRETPAGLAALKAAAADDPSPWVRASALFSASTQLTADFLAARLADPSPQVRCYAAALVPSDAITNTTAVAAALVKETHPRVRETMARVLAQENHVDQDPERAALGRKVAVRCLATETDPAARSALEALRDGGDPGPVNLGEGEEGRDPYGQIDRSHLPGRTLHRRYFKPSRLADDEDPGQPINHG